MSTEAGSVNSYRKEPRHTVAAILSSIALVISVVAFFLALAPFTAAALICFVTPVTALVLLWATPRLAVATLYWSAATIAGSPMFWNIPGNLLAPIVAIGIALLVLLLVHYLVLLLVHYLRAGRTP